MLLDRFKGLFAKTLEMIKRRSAKARYDKLSLYIIKRFNNDEGEKRSKIAISVVYFLFPNASNIAIKVTNKTVLIIEKKIIEI